MSNSRRLVTFASWEDRFVLGTEQILSSQEISGLDIFYLDQFVKRTEVAREKVRATAQRRGIDLKSWQCFSNSPSSTWTTAAIPWFEKLEEDDRVLVDLSTMPREIIWQLFWLLRRKNCAIDYVYHRPSGYGDWLSRDPGRPRLTYKMSGLSRLGNRTALVVTAGYDTDRVKHLIQMFEPTVTFLALQKDSIDPKNPQFMDAYRSDFQSKSNVRTFEIDAYEGDFGERVIEDQIRGVSSSHNVICTSMGPKLSSIALFRLHWKNESIGLVYLPANEYNQDYSYGIGEAIFGTVGEANHE